MFIENKYTKLYNQLINRAVIRNWKTKALGRERHHIVPASIGGSNDSSNLVFITAREHFICHWLLIKMTEGEYRNKMLYALMGMRAKNDLQQRYTSRITSRVYEKYRIEHAKNHSKIMKGKPAHNKGKSMSDAQKQLLREIALKRPPKSEETKEKWRKARLGYKDTTETKLKKSLALKGKLKGPMSEAEKLKRSITLKGQKKKTGHSDNVRNAVLGNISINKDGIEKKIKREALDAWLGLGWRLGGKPRQR